MSLQGFFKTDVVTCSADHLVTEAAQLMRDEHVCAIVVVHSEGGRNVPIGLLTDRDIVVGCVASASDRITDLSVEEVMTKNPLCAKEDMGVYEVIQTMRKNGVARMPVISADGGLIGIISSKNVLALLSDELTEVVSIGDTHKEAGQGAQIKGGQPSSRVGQANQQPIQ